MAGAVGTVPNRSGFASFIVKNWEAWMTEVVILHLSGMSIPELRHRFERTDTHLRNILNTEQAKNIVREIQSKTLAREMEDAPARISALKMKALNTMDEMLGDEEMKKKSPFAFWDASRKTLETVSRLDSTISTPSPQHHTNVQQNIQQNILNASPDVLSQLRNAPSLSHSLSEIPQNVEYLGSPPSSREIAPAVLGSGDSGVPSKSKNGLTLVDPRNSSSSE